MASKLLIANRGEIAVRIARTARRMGIATVAVFSDADRRAMHVAACDESMRLGGAAASESYLSIAKVIAAARDSGADAIHPGYGFLAESPALAEACAAADITFVGPSAEAMRRLGDKAASKVLAESIGVPVVAGYSGEAQGLAAFRREAKRIGYPLMVKAAAGGGGRGMRVVRAAGELAAAVESAAREAEAAFGDARLLLERLVERPRHVEVQVFADRQGNVVHMFERECSLQRRHQKVVEEAPAPGMSAGLREKLTGAAVRLARAAGYEGAGTVEFLVEGGDLSPEAPYYFIEANTRLQVEHPVTEQITGLDLVEWQLRIAAGEPLPANQDVIGLVSPHVSAIELRVCAEDPAHEFRPSTGRLLRFGFDALDTGTRLETGVREGDQVTPFYDSMIAKLVCTGSSRSEALSRAGGELARLEIAGPRTNVRFLHNLLDDEDVCAGRMDTGLIERRLVSLAGSAVSSAALVEGVAALLSARNATVQTAKHDPWSASDAFELGPPRSLTLDCHIDGRPQRFEARWSGQEDGVAVLRLLDRETDPLSHDAARYEPAGCFLVADGAAVVVVERGGQVRLTWASDDVETLHPGEAEDAVRAPITGRVAAVLVSEGAHVDRGDRVAIVEAMKMEHVLHAPRAGVVTRVGVRAGEQISEGALMVEIADAAEGEVRG